MPDVYKRQLSEGLALESILLNQPDVILIVPQGNEEAARAYMDLSLIHI